VNKNLRNFLPDYLFLFVVSGAALGIDQWTKWLVRENLAFGTRWLPPALEWLAPYARIVHWQNAGAAFGLFQNGGVLFAALAFLVAIVILTYFPLIPRSERYLRFALALQMGGALGNLADRLARGAVTDLVSILNFPVFNLADVSITLGVVLLLIPYLPHIPAEIHQYRLARRAKEINPRRRTPYKPVQPKPEDDTLSLGILEVVFKDVAPVRDFTLKQRTKRIRHKYLSNHKGNAVHQPYSSRKLV